MENVLYDLHIAEAEVSQEYNTFSGHEERKRELFNSVFEKHGIKSEQFDTSLVWYGAHLKMYVKIYDRLLERYTQEGDTLAAHILRQEDASSAVIPGKLYSHILHSSSLVKNKFSFFFDSFEPDTLYRFQLQVLGANENTPVFITMRIRLSDTLLIKRDTVIQNGRFTSVLPSLPEMQTKNVQGTIHTPIALPNRLITINDPQINPVTEDTGRE